MLKLSVSAILAQVFGIAGLSSIATFASKFAQSATSAFASSLLPAFTSDHGSYFATAAFASVTTFQRSSK